MLSNGNNMYFLAKRSKACMMIAASLIGGAVVGAVTVICVLLVNGGQSVTKRLNSISMTTSTLQSIPSTDSTPQVDDGALDSQTSSSATVTPIIRVRALEARSAVRFLSHQRVHVRILCTCTVR